MPTFIILFLIAAVFFVFYRIRASRIRRPYLKRWTLTKSGIAVGLFLFFFGLNQLFSLQHRPGTVATIICTVFMLYGAYVTYHNIKGFRILRPYVAKEAEDHAS